MKSEVGAVEILINNAGVVSGRKLVDCSDEQIELTMAVNCMALLFVRSPSSNTFFTDRESLHSKNVGK